MNRNITTHEISFKGITLTVGGTYYKGYYGNLDTPSDEEEFEIERIMVADDIDIMDLLSEEDIFEIEKLVIEKHYN